MRIFFSDTEHRNPIVALSRLSSNPRILLTMSHEGAQTLVCTHDSESGKRLLRYAHAHTRAHALGVCMYVCVYVCMYV